MMSFLAVSDCSGGIVSLIAASQKMIRLIQIIAPILLIVMASINLIRLMKDPDDKKGLPRIKNSFLAAALIFFIPMFVDVVMNMLGSDVTISACWNAAKGGGNTHPSYINPDPSKTPTPIFVDPSEYEKGTPKIVASPGVDEGKSGNMTYYVYVPNNATPNLPLIVWLHGDGGSASGAKNNPLGKTAENAGHPAIVVSPHSPNLGSAGNKGWYEAGHLEEVKAIADKVCEEYQCNKSNINIGGHSRGAIGTWMMVSKYGSYFHSAAPISCCRSGGFKPQNFKGIKVWAMRGSGAGSGSGNDDIYGSCMSSSVNSVKPYAKALKYTILPGTTHGGAGSNAVNNKEMVTFMLTD